MATATTTLQQSPDLNRRRQWWRRIPKTCCRREILILLVWQMLFFLSIDLQNHTRELRFESSQMLTYIYIVTTVGSNVFAPFFGWLADVKLGRYKVVIYGTLVSFATSILSFIGTFTSGSFHEVLTYIALIADGLAHVGFWAAILPFMTDQLIGATANELSAVVYWYYWFINLSICLKAFVICSPISVENISIATLTLSAAGLSIIIISDCLCQQWLDRTHKITNPIKLIIQVLNYARKHSYPERRSAFTYIDEEQPSRIDFGKEKFGGPFTEEEVEDVKTVLRLLPLITCICITRTRWHISYLNAVDNQYINCVLNDGTNLWIAYLLFIPLYQFLLYPLFHKWVPSMLKRIGAGLLLQLLGFSLGAASLIEGYTLSGVLTNYLTCTALNTTETPDVFLEWYWKLVPLILNRVGVVLASILLFEFAIAQSPDKMKGFVIGMIFAIGIISKAIETILEAFLVYTLCYDILGLILQTILFLVFLFLSKYYKLRERNREINIQAIAEEHFERYLDQEEEYMREQSTASLLDVHVIDT